MLRGRLVTIRALELDDLKHLWRWQNDPEVMSQLWVEPTSMRALEREYEAELGSEVAKRYLIVEAESRRPIGVIWYYSLRPGHSAGVGIYIGEADAQGRGYGTDALRTFLAFLFEVKQLHRVGLSASSENARAIACYSKCGFQQEGITREFCWIGGRWVDLVEMGILAREFKRE